MGRGQVILEQRTKLGLSREQLAERINELTGNKPKPVTRQKINHWEKGDGAPRWYLTATAQALGMHVAMLTAAREPEAAHTVSDTPKLGFAQQIADLLAQLPAAERREAVAACLGVIQKALRAVEKRRTEQRAAGRARGRSAPRG